MSESNWELAKELFVQVLALPENERKAFIDEQSKNNASLKEILLELLQGEDLSQNSEHGVSQLVGEQAKSILQNDYNAQKGQQIAEYQIENVLGEGGMGVVYLAKRKDEQFEQTVAIKIIQAHALVQQTLERFRQERQILASLQHPHIAQLLGGGETDSGLPYIIMEYVDGLDIVEYCKQHQLNIEARLDLFKQVIDAVSYAHQNLVIHRDLKPSNVLITHQGVVKLLDFGIAKLIEEKALPEDQNLTAIEIKVLTPANASPEQVRKEKVTTRTDVYGLSTLLYQMLTEKPLFNSENATSQQIESWIVDKQPTKPSANLSPEHSVNAANLQSTLSGDLDTIILKGLQKDPERRYASVEQFGQDIQYYLSKYPILAKPDSSFYKMSKFFQRNKALSIASGAFTVCLIGFSIAVSYQAWVIDEARKIAVRESSNAQQVTQFLTNTFKAANPYLAGDAEVTPLQLIDNAQKQVQEINIDSLLKLQLIATLAEVYKGIGAYDQVNQVLADADVLVKNMQDVPSILEYRLKSAEATAILETGDIEQAKRINDEIIQRSTFEYEKTSQSAERRNLAIILLNNLMTQGAIYDRLGQDDAALKVSLKALQIAKENDESVNLGAIYSGLGHTYRKLFDYEKSIEMLLTATDYNKLDYGEFNLELAYTYNQLASTYTIVDEFEKAEEAAKKGLEIRKKLYPRGNPEIAASLGTLSNIFYSQSDFEQAISYRKESIKEIKRALGDDHIYVGATILGLAGIQLDMKQFDAAEENALIALPIMQKHLPEDAFDLSRPYRTLGQIYYYKKDYDKALTMLDKAMAICEIAKPDGHWLTSEVHAYYALTYQALGKLEEAQKNKESALALSLRIFGEDNVRYKSMQSILSDVALSDEAMPNEAPRKEGERAQ